MRRPWGSDSHSIHWEHWVRLYCYTSTPECDAAPIPPQALNQAPKQASSHLFSKPITQPGSQSPYQPSAHAASQPVGHPGAVRWRRQASRAVTGRAPSQPASRAVKRRSQKNFPSRAVKILAQRNFRISSQAVKILAPGHPGQLVEGLTTLRFLDLMQKSSGLA